MKKYLIDLSEKLNKSIKNLFKDFGKIDEFKIRYKFEVSYEGELLYDWEIDDVYAGYIQNEDVELIKACIKHRFETCAMCFEEEAKLFNTFDIIKIDSELTEDPNEYETYHALIRVKIKVLKFQA